MARLQWHYERKKGPHYYDTRGALVAQVPAVNRPGPGVGYRVDGYAYNWRADWWDPETREGGPVGGAFGKGRHSTQTEAKAACQAHHDNRVAEGVTR